MPKRKTPKTVTTELSCPNCGEDLLFVMTTPDGAPLVSPTCFRAYWPSELTTEARQGNPPNEADLKGDRALWVEARKGKPDKPGKPSDVQQYALERILERVR